MLDNQRLVSDQGRGSILHQILHGLENRMKVPVEGRLHGGDTDAFFLRFLLLSGIDDEFEKVPAHFEGSTQVARLLGIGGSIQEAQVTPNETWGDKRKVELLVSVVVDQGAQIESSVVDNPEDGNQVIKNHVFIFLVAGVLDQDPEERIENATELLDNLDLGNKE